MGQTASSSHQHDGNHEQPSPSHAHSTFGWFQLNIQKHVFPAQNNPSAPRILINALKPTSLEASMGSGKSLHDAAGVVIHESKAGRAGNQ
jgi:hypothetical protein